MSVVSVNSNQLSKGFKSNTIDSAVQKSFAIEYMAIAGGAGGPGGGGKGSGGGGAGGLRSNVPGDNTGGGLSAENKFYVTLGVNYTVTVGAGGTGSATASGNGTRGTDTTALLISAISGGSANGRNGGGSTGGCGGGTGGGTAVAGKGGGNAGTVGQGFAGGGGNNSNYRIGGGGGTGEAGYFQDTDAGENGGAGTITTIISTSDATNIIWSDASVSSIGEVSGSDLYFGGGGGSSRSYYDPAMGSSSVDGTGGVGGGGDGNGPSAAGSATINSGGGGGGSSISTGGNGASGVVIFKYPSNITLTPGAGHVYAHFNNSDGTTTTVFKSGDDDVQFNLG